MTIKEQAALIPRPALEAVEVGENQFRFNVACTAVKATVEPANVPQPIVEARTTVAPALYGRQLLKDTLKTKIFDLRWGTNEYEELERARLAERRLQLRGEIGTGVVDRCAKHQHQLDKLRV